MGTEHMLLALLRSGEGSAAETLTSSGVTYELVRREVVRMMGMGVAADGAAGEPEPSFTGRAQDAIELARREAAERGKDAAGTEDILRALLSERDGAALRILVGLDADPAAIRSSLPS